MMVSSDARAMAGLSACGYGATGAGRAFAVPVRMSMEAQGQRYTAHISNVSICFYYHFCNFNERRYDIALTPTKNIGGHYLQITYRFVKLSVTVKPLPNMH
jgi:hypothetical protein